MKTEAKIEEQPVREAGGFAQRLRDFLKLIEDMGDKNHKVSNVSGELEGPFASKAAYGYTFKLGIEKNDFPLRRGLHSRPFPRTHVRLIRDEIVVVEPPSDVFHVAQMPSTKEKDMDFKLIDNILTITARVPEGEIERDTSVQDKKREMR